MNNLKQTITKPKIVIASLGTIIILGIEAIRKINKYKLIKENKFTSSIVIAQSPSIDDYHKSTEKIIIPPKIKEYIKYFIETLSNNLETRDMKIVKANINAVSYHQSILNSIYQRLITDSNGYYDPNFHQICLNKFETDITKIGFGGLYIKKDNSQNIEETLYHELLHAASSRKKDGIYFIGFMQDPPTIGVAINEGYTELLNQRYFQKDKEDKYVMYHYEVAVVEILELIIGKEKMTSLYFNNDLKGLVEELSKYQDIDKIKEFISNLDTINNIMMTKLLSSKQKLLLTLENSITIFLEETFKKKQSINQENKEEIQEKFFLLQKEMTQNRYSCKYSIFYSAETETTKKFYQIKH